MTQSLSNDSFRSESVVASQTSSVAHFRPPVRVVLASCVGLLSAVVFAQELSLSEATKDLEQKITVDCLTPVVMRKLGPGQIYTLPGSLTKMSAAQCKKRGGKFVLFDQASPKDALKVWMDAAEQGDDYAQFRVGQIYEMGVAGAPDYDAAAKWYKKAADQGNRPAAKNLAALLEKGNGVKQDKSCSRQAVPQGARGTRRGDRRVSAKMLRPNPASS